MIFLVGILTLILTCCSAPHTEEMRLVEAEQYLAILPFKKEGKYVAIEMQGDLKVISRVVKGIWTFQDLEKQSEELPYMLIGSIAEFDKTYRLGNHYFIVVKKFVNINSHQDDYYLIKILDEKNF